MQPIVNKNAFKVKKNTALIIDFLLFLGLFYATIKYTMTISWYGHACIKIITKGVSDVAIVIDPFDRSSVGLNAPRGKVDVVATSFHHPAHNAQNAHEGVFFVKGPGEYETKGIFIHGILGWHDAKKTIPVTLYRIEAEGMVIAHIGSCGQSELTAEQLDAMGDVDVLCIPVGGNYTIGKEKFESFDAEGAQRTINQIEPRIVIPIGYAIRGLSIDVGGPEKFLKAMGAGKPEELDKLVIKKKDLNSDGTKVVVLKAGKE